MSQRKIAPEIAGYTRMFDDIPGAPHDDCGDTMFFQVTCDQTDRLMTDGSGRNQQGHIRTEAFTVCKRVWCVLLSGYPLAAVGRDTDEFLRKLTDHTLLSKSLQHANRQPGIRVIRLTVGAIVANMGNPEIGHWFKRCSEYFKKLGFGVVCRPRSLVAKVRLERRRCG